MGRLVKPSPFCPEHGMPRDRSACRGCNAAYMRMYLWRRRQEEPDRELWRRARKRANRLGIPFNLLETDLIIPPNCPALGIPLRVGGPRSPHSPSLDRVVPNRGYVRGNVRIISDKANRLKGARSLSELRVFGMTSTASLRQEYWLLAEYVAREKLLEEVRLKAAKNASASETWKRIELFLDKVFSRGQLVNIDGY